MPVNVLDTCAGCVRDSSLFSYARNGYKSIVFIDLECLHLHNCAHKLGGKRSLISIFVCILLILIFSSIFVCILLILIFSCFALFADLSVVTSGFYQGM